MTLRTLTPLTLLLGLLLLTPGCILIAGAGAGYVISREISPADVYTAELKADVDHVWEATRETLEILADLHAEPEFTASPRTGKAKIDGSLVFVEVEAYDIDHTILRVKAEKVMVSDGRVAEMVQRKIIERL